LRVAQVLSALVTVVAKGSLRRVLAAGLGIARVLRALHFVVALGNRVRIDLADPGFIRFLVLHAHERTVAYVAVLQRFAILVRVTNTFLDYKLVQGQQLAGADTVLAVVISGTRIPVVTPQALRIRSTVHALSA